MHIRNYFFSCLHRERTFVV